MGNVNSSGGNTLTVASNYKKIGLCLYKEPALEHLLEYREVPMDIIRGLNSDNNGNVRVSTDDGAYMYARYTGTNKVLIWLNTEAETNGYYGVLVGIL